jgi:hypothetical protein
MGLCSGRVGMKRGSTSPGTREGAPAGAESGKRIPGRALKPELGELLLDGGRCGQR